MSFTPYDGGARWPFLFVLDANYLHTGWALVNAPIVTREQQQQFVDLRRAGYRFVGMSSYLTFPCGCEDDGLDYELVCDGWCHCFREPDRFLAPALPRSLISISDFTDFSRISPRRVAERTLEGRFDLVYVGANEEWKREAKNWRLAARTISRLCSEMGLDALVVGSPTDDFPPSAGVTFRDELSWPELLTYVAQARFLYVPNQFDASPRILAEALCLDVPVLVNRQILGGWKYVNRFTGAFFDAERDVAVAARTLCAAAVAPRAWFRANFGPYLAGKRLLALLRKLDPSLAERDIVRLSDPVAEPAPARLR